MGWFRRATPKKAKAAEEEPLLTTTSTIVAAAVDADALHTEAPPTAVLEEETISPSKPGYDAINTTLDHDEKEKPLCTPRECQLYRLPNLAIPICYLTVGLCQGLNRPLLNVYPLDAGATEAQQATINLTVMLSATLKIVFGMWSDNFPIRGYRRKPYMWLGWGIVVAIMLHLVTTTDLSLSYTEARVPIVPEHAPSMTQFAASFFLFGFGLWMADVMADSLVAEKARLELPNEKGHLQSTCYALRFLGLLVGAPCATWLYDCYGPWAVVTALAATPLSMFPLIYAFSETKHAIVPSAADQWQEIWKTICSRKVWQPIGFIYLYNLFQVPNAAWRQYLSTVLHFSEMQLNALLVVSYACLFLGTLTYKIWFLQMSWRHVYFLCLLVNGIFTGLQLCLLTGHTFGLDNFWFALGDDAAAEFISGIQFLPSALLFVALVPPGSEGASYAMFTTAMNAAILLAPSIASTLLGIWDVRVETLQTGDVSGLIHLTLLTTALQMTPLFFVGWMPHGRKQLQVWDSSAPPSRLGGTLFLLVLGGSLSYVLTVGILNIVHPGWAGES